MRILGPFAAFAILLGAVLAPAYAAERSCSASDLSSAFQAAFGAPTSVVRTVTRPRLDGEGRSAPERQVTLTMKPASLTPIGHGSYSLVALEQDVVGAHADPGAVAVAYLRRRGAGWQVERVWPELAWIGNTGNPGAVVAQPQYGGQRLVILRSDFLGQGQRTMTDWIVRLSPDAPRLIGAVPAGGALQDGCEACSHYAYASVVRAPRRRGDLISVDYAGWSIPAGAAHPIRFTARDDFALVGASLAPTARLSLPRP
jgi:hypothetical protein